MISDMERIGDQAADIADTTITLATPAGLSWGRAHSWGRAAIVTATDPMDSLFRGEPGPGLGWEVVGGGGGGRPFLEVKQELIRGGGCFGQGDRERRALTC